MWVRGRIQDPLGVPAIKLKLLIKDRYYIAHLAFKNIGREGEMAISGNLRVFNRFDFYFKGRARLVSDKVIEIKNLLVNDLFSISGHMNLMTHASEFTIKPKTGFAKFISNDNQKKGLSIDTKLNHLNLFGMDVLGQIYINTSRHTPAGSAEILRGSFKTKNLILNYTYF